MGKISGFPHGGDPYHDERGLFASAPDGTGVVQLAGGPAENIRATPESPPEELKEDNYNRDVKELMRLEPKNPALDRISSPDAKVSENEANAMRREVEQARIRAAQRGPENGTDWGKLPSDPDELKEKGFIETSNPEAAATGHRTFIDPCTGDTISYDKGRIGFPGFRGISHYHRENPESTGKSDRYLDQNGNPVAQGSKASHILPGS